MKEMARIHPDRYAELKNRELQKILSASFDMIN
jgi:hypothetical protein